MTKIYVIGCYTGKNSYGVIQDAGADGDVMGQAFIIRDGGVVYIECHYSSGAYWYRHDMGITSDWKHDTYKKYCPNGYELIDLGVYKNLEEMDARVAEVSKAARGTKVMNDRLYRGKRIDNGKWVYGYYVKSIHTYGLVDNPSYKIEYQIWYDKDNKQVYAEVDPETVGQCIGVPDKHGRMMFEDDIIEVSCFGYIPHSFIGITVFENGAYGVRYHSRAYPEGNFHRFGEISHWQDMGASGTETYEYVRIGNIHDNPELLKEKAE